MINATAPNIPTDGVPVDSPTTVDSRPARPFDQRWYRLLNDITGFLRTLRNAPQQVDQVDLLTFGAKMAIKGMQPGVQVWVPVFNHVIRWSGTAWTFAPGDGGSGYTQAFLTAPTADGWALCNAATVSYLKADGTIGNQVLPNTAGLYFRR